MRMRRGHNKMNREMRGEKRIWMKGKRKRRRR
jgi:hypothetical protein